MKQADHMVYVVDDDAAFCESIVDLLNAWDFTVMSFATAEDYIAAPKPDRPSCLVLDVGLPGITGLDLQQRLGDMPHPPIIFVTGSGDIPQAVQAMRAGASEFLMKPYDEDQLIDAVRVALQRNRNERAQLAGLQELRERWAHLTPREQEVLPLVVSGLLNKQAASMLGISQVTLQAHRSQIMKKMQAHSLADLVRMSSRLDLPLRDRSPAIAT